MLMGKDAIARSTLSITGCGDVFTCNKDHVRCCLAWIKNSFPHEHATVVGIALNTMYAYIHIYMYYIRVYK